MMGEMGESYAKIGLPIQTPRTPENKGLQCMHLLAITESSVAMAMTDSPPSITSINGELNPQDAWLPITESRNGNIFSSIFHLLSSGIGFQALLLPAAFSSLGWTWGITTLSLAFVWQLYTIWLLVHLHESINGIRYSRFLHLSITAFGQRLGKLLSIFPIMYLSGGTCVILIITGGGMIKLFFKNICGIDSLTGTQSFMAFTFIAIIVAQLPNLNSIAKISVIGGITAMAYCTLIWILLISKESLESVSYGSSMAKNSNMEARVSGVLTGIGIIALAFRGHNVVLEIQGTLPSSSKNPSYKLMWKGVMIAYICIAMCIFPLAVSGFWAFGDKIPTKGGMLSAFSEFHGNNTSKIVMGMLYILMVINSLSTFQIYAMPVFDNLEMRYTCWKKHQCPRLVRVGFRLCFGGFVLLVAVTFPFLGSLAALIGGIALPLTYSYPCFMWIAMKKLHPNCKIWWLNFVLGSLGIVLGGVVVFAAIWNIANNGINANFFRPE